MNARNLPTTSVNLAPIVSEIDRRLRGRLREFHIDREEQGLVLSGAAPSFYVKQLAQHAVKQMTRVPIARNDIHVLESPSA